MRIEFNKVTWYSRMLTIIFLFGAFPVLVFYIGKEYQKTMDVLTGANSLAIDMQLAGKIKTTALTNKEYKLTKEIVGSWQDVHNNKRVLVIKSMNRYFDWMDGAPYDSGVWSILSKQVLQSEESLAMNMLYLEFTSSGTKDSIIYSVQSIDDKTLGLYDLTNDKLSEFKKIKDEKVYLGE